jgi:hypothetical protein
MTQQQLFFFFFFVFFFFSQLLIPGYAICQAIDLPSSHKARLSEERTCVKFQQLTSQLDSVKRKFCEGK